MCDNLKGNKNYWWNCEIMIWDEIFKGYNVKEVVGYIEENRKEKLSKEVVAQLEMMVQIENLKWDLEESKRILELQWKSMKTRDDEIKKLKAENEKIDRMYDELKIKEEMRDSYIKVTDSGDYIEIKHRYRNIIWKEGFKKNEIERIFVDMSDKCLTIMKTDWNGRTIKGFKEHTMLAFDKIEKILNKN